MKTNKTIFITGGNAGIGKHAAIQLVRAGHHVIIGCRNQERGEAALAEIKEIANSEKIELQLIDLSSQASIKNAAEGLTKKLQQLDVLIHNAADFDIARKQPVQSIDGIETIWATNHIGPILLTNLLLPLLKKSAQGRILTVASKGLIMYPKLKVDLIDPEFKNRKFSVPKAYYQSKLAQVMYTYWLAEELKETSISVNCIRVTNVKIDLNRYPNISGFMKFLYSIKSKFSLSPQEMAKTYTYMATSDNVKEISGKYFDEKNEIVSSSTYSRDEENCLALMELSKGYLKK